MKQKILFLIADLGGGGAEKVLVNLVNALPTDKYDITIRTIFGKGINAKFLAPHIKYSSLCHANDARVCDVAEINTSAMVI